MKKIKRPRRRLLVSDFRKHPLGRDNFGILLCEGNGFINVNKIRDAFPDKQERYDYIKALYKGLEPN